MTVGALLTLVIHKEILLTDSKSAGMVADALTAAIKAAGWTVSEEYLDTEDGIHESQT